MFARNDFPHLLVPAKLRTRNLRFSVSWPPRIILIFVWSIFTSTFSLTVSPGSSWLLPCRVTVMSGIIFPCIEKFKKQNIIFLAFSVFCLLSLTLDQKLDGHVNHTYQQNSCTKLRLIWIVDILTNKERSWLLNDKKPKTKPSKINMIVNSGIVYPSNYWFNFSDYEVGPK